MVLPTKSITKTSNQNEYKQTNGSSTMFSGKGATPNINMNISDLITDKNKKLTINQNVQFNELGPLALDSRGQV